MGASACCRGVDKLDSKHVEIKDGQGKILRCIKLESKRPDFLANMTLCATRHLQRCDPTKWAMTNVQLLEFFSYMRSTPEYEAAKQARGHVCLYDVNSLFVIPWSRGFGCGVALLMNARAPLKAQVMISHAWAEDVEELVSSLSFWASRIQPLWASDPVPLWCCTFAQYQPEDGAGPSLQKQLSLDPFRSVIQSKPKHGMVVVHTTKADPYDRLWCVHEIEEALDSKLFVTAIGTYSLGGRTVCTRTAKCGHLADEERIRAVIESKAGGYERLDKAIKAFRNTLLKSGTSVVAEIQVPLHKYSGGTNCLNLEGLGLAKVCCELLEFGVGWSELFSLFTLTDSDGRKIPFEPFEALVAERASERDMEEEFPEAPQGEQDSGAPGAPRSIRIPDQLAQQQFPLRMTCAFDVRYRQRLPQTEVAPGSYTIETVFATDDVQERRWNNMKLHHPVLCGQWMSGTLEARRRVGIEILDILGDATENADLFRFDFRQRNLSHWSVYLRGPKGTPYDCGWFAAGIDLPDDYPYRPPKFKILTKILHPNVSAESGEVCINILLSEHWSALYRISKVVLSVVALLGAPEPRDPMNLEAATRQLRQPELFEEKARLWTQTYALPEPPSFRDLGIGTLSSL